MRDSVNSCSMDDGLKCDAFGYINRSIALLNFEISLFADIPMLPGGVSGFCNKSKIICAEP